MKRRRLCKTSKGMMLGTGALVGLLSAGISSQAQAAGPDYVVPMRWCGEQGAPMMTDPGLARPGHGVATGEGPLMTPEAVMRWRSGRPEIQEVFSQGDRSIAFASSIPHQDVAEERMFGGFPMLYSGRWDEKSGLRFGQVMDDLCREAWEMGDSLYFDADGDSKVSEGDFWLRAGARSARKVQSSCAPSYGAPLERLEPSRVMEGVRYGFVDLNENGRFDPDGREPIYRYEQDEGSVAGGVSRKVQVEDVLLFPVAHAPLLPGDVEPGSGVLNYDPEHVAQGWELTPFSGDSLVKYVDNVMLPAREFSIGFGHEEFNGIYAVSVDDAEIGASRGAACGAERVREGEDFQKHPVLGSLLLRGPGGALGERLLSQADLAGDRVGCGQVSIVVDDLAWTRGNEDLQQHETRTMSRLLAGALGLPFGDGVDNDGNGLVDDVQEDDCLVRNGVSGDMCTFPGVSSEFLEGMSSPLVSRGTCLVSGDPADRASQSTNVMQFCGLATQNELGEISMDVGDENFDLPYRFSPAQFEAMVQYSEHCGFGVQTDEPKGTQGSLGTEPGASVPECKVTDGFGMPIEKMDMRGRALIWAKGLVPGSRVELEINGQRITGHGANMTTSSGETVVVLHGEEVPVILDSGEDVPVAISVSGGSEATASCGVLVGVGE